VISRNLIAEIAAFKPEPLRHYVSFVTRRVFRIIPPNASYIAVGSIAIRVAGASEQFHEIPLFRDIYLQLEDDKRGGAILHIVSSSNFVT